jgi:uncharacterized protein
MENSSPWQALERLAQQISPVWVALSGGIDSLWLLYFLQNIAAIEVHPVFFDHPGVYPEERVKAKAAVAAAAGLVLTFTLEEMQVVWGAGPKERCYRCKNHLFSRAAGDVPGSVTICDGSHIDDVPARRPGMRALSELGILSPLRICGWDKSMIREAARKAGLEAWSQPARACLVVDGKLRIN